MSYTPIVKQGCFDADVVNQINAMLVELYATTAVSSGLLSATPGTVAASKAVIVDANKHQDVIKVPVSGLAIGASGSEVAVARTAAELNLLVQGVAAGYKIARGVHTQVAAEDSFATGLATVVQVVACFKTGPTVKQLYLNVAPEITAGVIVTKTYKPTAVNDCTPTPATDFTDNLTIGWIALGT